MFFFFWLSFKRTILGGDREKMGEVENFWDFSSQIFKRRDEGEGGGVFIQKIWEERESQGLAA